MHMYSVLSDIEIIKSGIIKKTYGECCVPKYDYNLSVKGQELKMHSCVEKVQQSKSFSQAFVSGRQTNFYFCLK